MFKKTLVLCLLTIGLAFGKISFLPDQLIVCLKNPVVLREVAGKVRTGIVVFDQVLEETKVSSLTKPFSQNGGNFPYKDKILLLHFPANTNLERTISKFRSLSEVVYIIKHNIYDLQFTPDDSLFIQQYYLPQIKAPQAWDLADSTAKVIVGIIDSGVEYTHPDLAPNIWLNPGEDQPPFGILNSADYNGIDDDENGYIDDLVGWDFFDAPELPFGSDYLTPDNDPMDTFGHGTAVAGLVAAKINNSTGIAGAANNALIMPLRCSSTIYLNEIAIAQAIIYAVNPWPQIPDSIGASIINMSFGTTEISPLLQDIIEFAASKDVILIASSGNDGSAQPYYPAFYAQTISVGAIDQNNQVLGISNRGASLDLVAPGLSLISTVPDAGYGYFWGGTGTSFSAPLVSAACAMIRGLHPEFSAEEVRSIILTSANDLYQTGWDSLSGYGRLNCENALLTDEVLVTQITSPVDGSGFNEDTLLIYGTASGLYLAGYSLSWGYGYNPSSYTVFRSLEQKQIINDYLGPFILNSTFLDTVYTIKLTATDQFGFSLEDKVTVYYFTQYPQISDIHFYPAISGDRYAYIITFKTDQLCTSLLRYTNYNTTKEFNYTIPDTVHRKAITQSDLQGIFNCQIKVYNSAGMETVSDIFENVIILNQPPYNTSYYYIKKSNILPSGHILPQVSDFDNDVNVEVFLSPYSAPGIFDSLQLYEYDNGIFQPSGYSYGITLPQDIGDSDEDGLLEMMSRAFGWTYIYEQPAIGFFPSSLIYIDSLECYGSKLLNLVPDDGHGEIFLRRDSLYTLNYHYANGSITFISSIQPSGMNGLGTPHSEWGDFNSDGNLEVLFGDNAGHIFLYTLSSNSNFTEVFRDSLPFNDTRDFLVSGDFNGDSIPEFFAGCHSLTGEDELQGNIAYWQFYLYQYADTTGFQRADSFFFLGASDPELFDAGLSNGDVDDDGILEILISIYPHLYLVDFADSNYVVTWHYTPCASNQVLVYDLDGNGLPEIVFNRGQGFASFETTAGPNSPPIPMGITVTLQNPTSLKLTWNSVPNIQWYQISRATNPDSLVDVYAVFPPDTSWINTGLISDRTYYYAVSTYKNGQYSPLSQIVAGTPTQRPMLIYQSFVSENPHILRLGFNEAMNADAGDPGKYTVSGIMGIPSSAVLEADGKTVNLYFGASFSSNMIYTLTIGTIHDQQGATLANTGPFTLYTPNYPQPAPYLVRGILLSNGVLLEFSQIMDADTSALLDRYSITFGLSGVVQIDSVQPDPNDLHFVTLFISPHTPLSSLGNLYTVAVNNLCDENGVPIDPGHSSITLAYTADNLKDVFTYPNPYRAGDLIDGEPCLVFANLTSEATIYIYNISGDLVKKLHSAQTFGGIKWYLDNQKGEKVGNGIYIYFVEGGEDKFVGKTAIMR